MLDLECWQTQGSINSDDAPEVKINKIKQLARHRYSSVPKERLAN